MKPFYCFNRRKFCEKRTTTRSGYIRTYRPSPGIRLLRKNYKSSARQFLKRNLQNENLIEAE
ncbi:MAG: hypothetical protein LBT43_19160 [Prevotella sp.]|jgi:hypothetical protein|nr:hypothetical protein [Prevotella sp.]